MADIIIKSNNFQPLVHNDCSVNLRKQMLVKLYQAAAPSMLFSLAEKILYALLFSVSS